MKVIAFSVLALGLLRIPVAAQESDPFAGDARLLKKHTIKAAGIPLKELLEQLTKETGISLTAGPRVAEDKIVLFANDRPLADSLTAISRFFNFYWGRSGNPRAYSYILSQSLRQKQAELPDAILPVRAEDPRRVEGVVEGGEDESRNAK